MPVRCISCQRVFADIFESVRHECPRVAGPRLIVELEQEPETAKDLTHSCPQCKAAMGSPCLGLKAGVVHIGRRILRLMAERKP